jgi:pimeloyl-ACP methyl ester carboxylesterase
LPARLSRYAGDVLGASCGACHCRLSCRRPSAVAPWLRGYAPSPVDGEFGDEALGADLLTQCHALGCTRVIGHDWGALAVYAAIRQAPTQLGAAVTLAVPALGAVLRNLPRDPGQLWRSRYILRFQLPDATRFLRQGTPWPPRPRRCFISPAAPTAA